MKLKLAQLVRRPNNVALNPNITEVLALTTLSTKPKQMTSSLTLSIEVSSKDHLIHKFHGT
ncbi:hypothetical protein ISN45_At01g012430 [Arabidopsis thaliana x Arabidopsis arenosa]|uniref:Uncharacterized protein n=2 Tax=Arabidopsis TaxID=3701 RepID=A0A8T2CC27_ARASU|nr:hypothetical protein ISN44_As06g012170 [Arabidopsis suecica]KAG7646062.1 hypothetical protein ISN45_At01g012430 [Arabidopsis thaliana x Arabidopsis arenosa]